MESLEILSGVLSVKRSSILKPKKLDKQFCILFHGVRTLSPRIDLYESNPRVTKAPCKKTVYIESAKWRKVDAIEPAFSFEVKNGKQYIFYCTSRSEQQEWILTLCCICGGLFDSKHLVGVSNEGAINATSVPGDEYSVVVANDVYGGISDVHTFFVLADNSEGCQEFRWKGIFKLSIGRGCVWLIDPVSDARAVEWKITELRNYGHSTHTMFVQTGKRSATGEWRFTFRTTESSKIIGTISREAELLQSRENGTGGSHSPIPPVSNINANEKEPVLHSQDNYASTYATAVEGTTVSDVTAATDLRKSNESNKKKAPAPPPPKPSMKVTGSVQGYTNIIVNSEPPPVSPSSLQSQLGKPHDKSFLKELDSKLETKPANVATRKDSVATLSSDSTSKKENKKHFQDLKKEQKRQEEQEKKLRKKQLAEEKKRLKEEAKKQKDKAKLGPTLSSPVPFYAESDNVYALVDESENSSCKSLPPLPTQANPTTEEDHYAVAGDFPARPLPAARQVNDTTSQIYHEPWGKTPIFPPPPSPTKPQQIVSQEFEDDAEAIYAEPQKKDNTKSKQTTRPGLDYEDTDSLYSADPPAIVPPQWEKKGLFNNNTEDLYSHTNLPPLTEYGHVYGIGSASKEFTPNQTVDTSSSADIYDSVE